MDPTQVVDHPKRKEHRKHKPKRRHKKHHGKQTTNSAEGTGKTKDAIIQEIIKKTNPTQVETVVTVVIIIVTIREKRI